MLINFRCGVQRLIIISITVMLTVYGTAHAAGAADPVSITGEKSVLVIVVHFPDIEPWFSLPRIRKKASKVDKYIRTVSYDKLHLRTKVVGSYKLPAPLSSYKVSPFNFKVDRGRVHRLLKDALHVSRREANPDDYDYIWIVVGAITRPARGYGMIAYAANPGILSGVRHGRASLVGIKLPDGRIVTKPVIVSAENAHIGHVAHDLLHAIGGVSHGRRTIPDLYNFELQSNPPDFAGMHPRVFATYVGPWDLLSQHFVEFDRPAPLLSSFNLLQLGWLGSEQVVTIHPGETRELTLAPLHGGKGLLVVRIHVDKEHYLLLENRQPYGCDTVQSASGLLILKVDNTREEGAGIVTAVNANPGVTHLRAAPFLPGSGERRHYIEPEHEIAIAPLAIDQQGNLRLVVTTPERITAFITN